jgi:hypothetical protein
VGKLAVHLVCLCHDAAQAQESALLQQLVSALARLAAYWPAAVLPHAADLGLLFAPGQAAGSAEAKALLALLAQILTSSQPQKQAVSAISMRQLAALQLPLLLQLVAFGASSEVKQWASHLLGVLHEGRPAATAGPGGSKASLATTSTIKSALLAVDLHGSAATAYAAQRLLQQLWSRPAQAQHWLASLQLRMAAAASEKGGGAAAKDSAQLDSHVALLVCALLQHPDELVQHRALQALLAAVEAAPLLGLSLLPLLVHQLQAQLEVFLSGERLQLHTCDMVLPCTGLGMPRGSYCCPGNDEASHDCCLTAFLCFAIWFFAGKTSRPSSLLLELLQALPTMGRHPAATPFVLRTLQPLLGPGQHAAAFVVSPRSAGSS